MLNHINFCLLWWQISWNFSWISILKLRSLSSQTLGVYIRGLEAESLYVFDGADDESERVFLRDRSLTIELFGHYSPSLRINVGQELRKLSIIVNWKLRLLEFYWILLWEKKISPNNSLDASARHWWHLVTTFFQCVSLIDVSKYCQDKFSSA